MTASITARMLFERLRAKLRLRWVGGQSGAERAFEPEETKETSHNLIGHLNFIRPNRVQVLGLSELEYLQSLRKNSYHDAVGRLFSEGTVMVVIANAQPVPQGFLDLSERQEIPLISSRLDSNQVVNHMRYVLSNLLAEKTIVHGVFMEVMGIGVLLTGESSVGKSELALELITRGHRLIADDAPEFSLVAPDIVSGGCPEVLKEFLEVRGLGVVNVRAMFGDSVIKQNKYLRLIIHLEQMNDDRLREIDRLQGSHRVRRIVGVDIPEITIPVAPGRDLAVLVETAVRLHILSVKGYEAYREFVKRQQDLMQQSQGAP